MGVADTISTVFETGVIYTRKAVRSVGFAGGMVLGGIVGIVDADAGNQIMDRTKKWAAKAAEADTEALGRFTQIKKEQQQNQATTKQDSRNRVGEIEMRGQSDRVAVQGEHHERSSKIAEDLTTKAETAKSHAKADASKAKKAELAIVALEEAAQDANEAHARLQEAISSYEKTVTQGELEQAKIKAVHEAVLNAIIAESNLQQKLEVSTVEHASQERQQGTRHETQSMERRSELKQQIAEDAARREANIDRLLASQSIDTLSTIESTTKRQIDEQHRVLDLLKLELGKPESQRDTEILKKLTQAEEHLGHLQTMLAKTDKIKKASELLKPEQEKRAGLDATVANNPETILEPFTKRN